MRRGHSCNSYYITTKWLRRYCTKINLPLDTHISAHFIFRKRTTKVIDHAEALVKTNIDSYNGTPTPCSLHDPACTIFSVDMFLRPVKTNPAIRPTRLPVPSLVLTLHPRQSASRRLRSRVRLHHPAVHAPPFADARPQTTKRALRMRDHRARGQQALGGVPAPCCDFTRMRVQA